MAGARTDVGRPPNLVTIILDCVRAKSTRIGGGARVAETPVMDALSRKGTVFSRAVAPANWTVPSVMSMNTGTYPSLHGRRGFVRGPPPFETAAAWLSRAGYETAVFTEQVHLVSGYGLEGGFDYQLSPLSKLSTQSEDRTTSNQLFSHADFLYSARVRELIDSLPPFVVPINMVNHASEVEFKRRVTDPAVLDGFAAWLAQRSTDRPFHVLFNFVDGHEPYPRTRDWSTLSLLERWYARTPKYYLLAVPRLQAVVPWKEFEGGYLLSVGETDRKVGVVLEALRAAGELERTFTIVTADHGQCFGEGGHVFHGNGAVDAVSRVPLVIVPPEGMTLPRRVDQWTSLCEVPGWLKAAAKGLPAFGDDGRAPAPYAPELPDSGVVYCEGNPAGDMNHSLKEIGRDRAWNHRLVAAYRGDEKFVLDMETNAISRWTLREDPDWTPAEALDGAERDRVRAAVFGPYFVSEAAAPAPSASAELQDRRMRSWGYD